MSEFWPLDIPASLTELQEAETGRAVRAPNYSLYFREDKPYIELYDQTGKRWMDIYNGSDVNSISHPDVTYRFEKSSFEKHDNSIEARILSHTGIDTPKTQVWKCHDNFIETYIETAVPDGLKSIRLLGGTTVGPNLFGTSMSQRYFNSVYNPQPSEMERSVIPALESTEITTSGMWKPGRRREFLMTPFCFGFNMSGEKQASDAPQDKWLMASVSAPIEDQSMITYRYEAHEDGFSLVLDYDAVDEQISHFRSPSLLLHFADSPEDGLHDFTKYAKQLGHLTQPSANAKHAWHKGSTLVSWGGQVERANTLEKQGISVAARDLATEDFVTSSISRLEKHSIAVDKLIIDDKWQEAYGTNTPDTEKWPDMRHFISTQHELGRRVLLWMKLFDPEGLPPELCIVDKDGRPIASDPTNPDYIECVREQVRTLLDPDEYDADGLKLDFLAQLPHGPGLRWQDKQRGHAALYNLMTNMQQSAKQAKPDSLIQAHIVSPWFADSIDQVRLNDTNEHRPIIQAMGRRAALTAILLPNHSTDPDGWPMPNKDAWKAYIAAQPDISGTVTTHYSESVHGEPIDTQDLEVLADAIRRSQDLASTNLWYRHRDDM